MSLLYLSTLEGPVEKLLVCYKLTLRFLCVWRYISLNFILMIIWRINIIESKTHESIFKEIRMRTCALPLQGLYAQ